MSEVKKKAREEAWHEIGKKVGEWIQMLAELILYAICAILGAIACVGAGLVGIAAP